MPRLSPKAFQDIVRKVLADLPADLHAHMGNVIVDVLDEPDDDMLRAAGFTDDDIAAGDSLYGLFVPFPIDTEALDLNDRPHRILIFQKPLEDDFPDRAELIAEIRKTVIHELAHHFGYSDDDLARWTKVF